MSRLMNADQHNQLMLLRGHLCAAVVSGDHDATQSATGRVQGYLLGLYATQEIEFCDVEALEAEINGAVAFLRNARKAGHAN